MISSLGPLLEDGQRSPSLCKCLFNASPVPAWLEQLDGCLW